MRRRTLRWLTITASLTALAIFASNPSWRVPDLIAAIVSGYCLIYVEAERRAHR